MTLQVWQLTKIISYNHSISAVSNNDYNAVNGEIIQFNTGDTNKQHRITINDDPFCEVPDEQFFSDITLVSGIPMIDVTVPRAVVIITNDSIPDCGKCKIDTHVYIPG